MHTPLSSLNLTDIYKSAEVLLQHKEYVLARTLYSYLRDNHGKSPEILRGLGICMLRLSDNTSAKNSFRTWHEKYQSQEALIWYAKSLLVESEYTEALKVLQSVTQPANLPLPIQIDYWTSLSICKSKNGDAEGAEEALQNAIQLKPQSHTLWTDLGFIELQKKAYHAAETRFRKSIELKPKNSRAYSGLALVSALQGALQMACLIFQKALEIDPQNWFALEQWVHLSLSAPLYLDPALENKMIQFIELQPKNSKALALAALYYEKLDRRFDSQRCVKKALEIDPRNIQALLVKNRVLN